MTLKVRIFTPDLAHIRYQVLLPFKINDNQTNFQESC